IALDVGEPEQPFLQNRIAAVPQRDRKTQAAFAVGPAEETVFTPAVCAAACMVVGKVLPCLSIGRVIFADGSPLSLGEIWTPALPVFCAAAVLVESKGFSGNCHTSASTFYVRCSTCESK